MSKQSIADKYNTWLASPKVSSKDKQILKSFSETEINDAFFRDIEFGTAGIRGIIGPGTNRINYFTIRKAVVAFAKTVLERFPDAKTRGIAIAHDNRHMSREFTLDSAETLNRLGINTYIFNSLRPTPVLSFAVRYSNCVGGIMITASHNPKEYNGLKVYDETGCQLVPAKLERLLEINAELPSHIELQIEDAPHRGVNKVYGDEVDNAYIKEVEAIQLNPDLPKDNFPIVFSPQHGTSYELGMKIFDKLNYEVHPVKSQSKPDPDFGGTPTPNPEDPRAYEEAIKLAKKVNAKIILVTDPDADRVGVAYSDEYGDYNILTGNESGTLLLHYILNERKKRGLLTPKSTVYSTIVTTEFAKKVANSHGVNYKKFLTGFRYIGEAIEQGIQTNTEQFEFGFEESYGCLIAPFVRDKDALQALLMYAEMANYYLVNYDQNLGEAYDALQQQLGYHNDEVYSIEFPGAAGDKKMKQVMSAVRSRPYQKLISAKVVRIEDYFASEAYDKDGVTQINLPKSDVIAYYLFNDETIIIRPSGTEPKIKFYYGVSNPSRQYTEKRPAELHRKVMKQLGLR